jgi:hypothetical protein
MLSDLVGKAGFEPGLRVPKYHSAVLARFEADGSGPADDLRALL